MSGSRPETEKNGLREKDGGLFVIEKIDLSGDSDVDLNDDVGDISDVEDVRADEEDLNDLERLISTTKDKAQITQPFRTTNYDKKTEPKAITRLEVIDDFIRNFLIKNNMKKSLEAFQSEWYELTHKGKFSANDLGQVPDVYIKNEKLEEKIEYLTGELDKAKILAEKAKATWDKLRKERDFHKMHHRRVQQEKTKLSHDIEKLRGLHVKYEEKYVDLSNKYEAAMKEKMLLKLERDRLLAKSDALQKTVEYLEDKMAKDNGEPKDKIPEAKDTKQQSKSLTKNKPTPFPDEKPNPYLTQTFDIYNCKSVSLSKTFKGHMMAASAIAMHPKKSIVATASDDLTWKIWTIPGGEMVMSAEGHKDWISGIDFHPRGTHLATSSGDSTIKIWDFVNSACSFTFKDHIQPVWSISFHESGDFLVTASMDHSSKLFDLNIGKSRYTFRGHVDSVNHVMFQPHSNLFATASADKTLSLWDMKSGLCVQTFYGHLNSVNHCAFSLKGDTIASCDSDGVVKTWDVKMNKERSQFDCGPYAANSCAFDKSGMIIAVASDDGYIKLYNESLGRMENNLKGHEDAVQDVKFDYNSKMLVSCSSDATFRVWQ